MDVTLWGTRGSLATPGPETARYGGNTSCVGVRGGDGTLLVLDAGTGIRRLGGTLDASLKRVDILLTHLHMDHIQGLGFFAPLYRPGVEVNIWGPVSSKLTLRERIMRYLSPPLFPVSLRELPCELSLHEVPCGEVDITPARPRVIASPMRRATSSSICRITNLLSVHRRFLHCLGHGPQGVRSPPTRTCSFMTASTARTNISPISAGDTARSSRRWTSRRSPRSSTWCRFITILLTPTST